jgi:hypothetical protein
LVTSSNTGTTSETINYTAAAGVYYARVYPANTNTFNATTCYTLKVQLGTATRSEEEMGGIALAPSFEVYPNPVMQTLNLNVKGLTSTTEVAVYNASGIQVMRQRINNGNNKMTVSGLTGGVYLIRYFNGKSEVGHSKFVKY